MKTSSLRVRSALVVCALAVFSDAVMAHERRGHVFSVASNRVLLGDLVADAPLDLRPVDLGPAPMPGGVRVILRDAVRDAYTAHARTAPSDLPPAFTVGRRMQSLTAHALEARIRESVGTTGLPRGVTLTSIHCPPAVVVPDGWDALTVELLGLPRRAGAARVSARVSLRQGADELAVVSVPMDVALDAEAVRPDVVHGAPVQLLIRRGLVEVSSPATAGVDARVGDVFPVVLHPSGRTLRARLIDGTRALWIDDASPNVITVGGAP